MKIANKITTNYVDIFEDGATFKDEVGMRYIILRLSDRKKCIFTVLTVSSVSEKVGIETRSSADLMKLKYIGTAEINLDIKITETTGWG